MRYYPLIDKRISCENITNQITKADTNKKNTFTNNIADAEAFLVAGGDWFMLQNIRKYIDHRKPFVWYNCGTLWFLMNHVQSIHELPIKFTTMTKINSQIIELTIKTKDWKTHQGFCINDVTIGDKLTDYFQFTVHTGKWENKIQWTWLVIATSIWATWYTLNLWTPILPLQSQLWTMAGIWTRPFHFKYLEPTTSTIFISGRKPVDIACDGHKQIFHHVTNVTLKTSQKYITLWFCPQQDFESKRVVLAAQKLW